MPDDILIPARVVHERVLHIVPLPFRLLLDRIVHGARGVVHRHIRRGVPPPGVQREPCLVGLFETEGVTATGAAGPDEGGGNGLEAQGECAGGDGGDGGQLRGGEEKVGDFLVECGGWEEGGGEPVPSEVNHQFSSDVLPKRWEVDKTDWYLPRNVRDALPAHHLSEGLDFGGVAGGRDTVE